MITTIMPSEAPIKPYLTKELADLYDVTPHTLRRWLRRLREKVGHPEGRTYNVNQVRTIFNELGRPEA